ncbi:MAG: FAD-dependent oxidoreductase [Candidatus Aenigmatarchaeota archaeon]
MIGGAAAGLTAAIYSARRKMSTLIITKDVGGQVLGTDVVENYPGFLSISGKNLSMRMMKQAIKAGAQLIQDEVIGIEENGKEENFPIYIVKTAKGNEYRARTIILAYGKTPRNLDVPGEAEFGGKGVSYCATCDMPLFKNKTVAIVGGGNSAFDAALYASKICKKVYLIHRRKEFRAFEYLIDQAKKRPNIEFLLDTIVTEILGIQHDGAARVTGIRIKNAETGEEKIIDVDGVFVEIGSVVKIDMIKNLVKLDENNQVVVTNMQETFYPNSDEIRPGIFAAGDLTNTPVKQLVVSAAEGCKAAMQAYNYLHNLTPKFIADWVAKKHGGKE